MKLLCINTDILYILAKGINYPHTGDNLILGKIYTTKGKPFIKEFAKGNYSKLVYFIDELQTIKLTERFTEAFEENEMLKLKEAIKEPQLN